MGSFWSAILGAVVGTVGSGLVMLLVQSRAWKHETEVRHEDLLRNVMPYITFKVDEEGTSHQSMGADGVSFRRFEQVVARNEGRGLATFAPSEVVDSRDDSRVLGGFPVGSLRRFNLPTALKPGDGCVICLHFPSFNALPGSALNQKYPFEYSDMYGNCYTSNLTIYRIPDKDKMGGRWAIHAGQPELMPTTLLGTRPDQQGFGEGGAPHDLG